MPEVTIGRAGGAALAMVSADQETILGNGTQLNPLRASGGGIAFVAQYFDEVIIPFLGMAVSVVENGVAAFGITQVEAATAGLAVEGIIAPRPFVVGLVTSIVQVADSSYRVTVQHAGRVTLTIPEWEIAADELFPGSAYYLSFGFDDFGHLTTQVANISQRFVAPIGVALSATTLQLILPTVPEPA